MLYNGNSDYHLSCRLTVDPRIIEVIEEMIAVQSVVYFEEVELVFDKVKKFEVPSFLYLSLQKGDETVVPDYIKIFPAMISQHEDVIHLFQEAMRGKVQVEWHDLRNHFLQEYRSDLELLLRKHREHQHIFGSILLREREFEPVITAPATP